MSRSKEARSLLEHQNGRRCIKIQITGNRDRQVQLTRETFLLFRSLLSKEIYIHVYEDSLNKV